MTETNAAQSLDRDTLRCAAAELRARGLTPLDIGELLRIGESAVRELLAMPARELERARPE